MDGIRKASDRVIVGSAALRNHTQKA